MTCQPAAPIAPIRWFTLFSSRVLYNCSAVPLLGSRRLPVSLCGSPRSPKHLLIDSHGCARLYCLADGFPSRRTQVRFPVMYFRTGPLRRFIYRATQEARKRCREDRRLHSPGKGVADIGAGFSVGYRRAYCYSWLQASRRARSSIVSWRGRSAPEPRCSPISFACHIKGRNPVELRPRKPPGGKIKN